MGTESAFLPGVPVELVLERFRSAAGNELDTGKFFSPESSAALVANAFGFFLQRGGDLPALPIDVEADWPPSSVQIEVELRFPWAGGRHPWLDAVVETPTMLIGIESKRYESFRHRKDPDISDAYCRPVWGEEMTRYCALRDGLRQDRIRFERVDAPQLMKHAFGLRTAVHREGRWDGKTALLLYLHCEPNAWPDGRPIPAADIETHRAEIERFAAMVDGDEVAFRACTYRQLLDGWRNCSLADVRAHADAVLDRFGPL